MIQNILGLAASYGYALLLLVGGEVLHRRGHVPGHITRKLIHIGAGLWVFGVLALFHDLRFGLLPFASFVLVNYLIYRLRLSRAMGESSPGTVYFALMITILFALFWRPGSPNDRVALAVAGAMALTWGDALAALVGQRWGQRRYRIGGGNRTWEGSATMFVASVLAIGLSLWLVPGSSLSPAAAPIGVGRAFVAALVAAAAATLAEAASPHGTDNLSVPLVAALVAGLLTG